MRIVYFGSSEFGIPSLDALVESGKEIVHLFTQPAHRAGRGRLPRPTPVSVWADDHRLDCTETGDINASVMIEKIAALKADLLVVIAFGQKIGNAVLNLFDKGAINVHASLLPEYRGAAPINWAIIDGKTETGISIITVARRMDAGDILAQAKCSIEPEDTAETLHDKLAYLSPLTLLETVDRIAAGTATYIPQDESRVSIAKKLKKSDGFITFSEPAQVLVNKIRGLWPWPGVHADFVAGRTGKCYPVIFVKGQIVSNDDNPGTYGKLDENLNIICGKDRLKILELKPAGKNRMNFGAFVRGRNVLPGDVFLPVQSK
ncbi:MAG: methionyl-tRNA formyltransferase [Sedimentisphaerales bacterium]|nr:methionyl-tRNA formyltransferase [Sedimentisphaerales bacterium]